ncbi:SRPBCC family protein [Nocardioides cynanchi]|uniref:SRPBCC family protein n=1 Tax=Nocardioides cynanchi TaxID=2558918 RepID=UPI00124720AC|nr:SRPBCC family protein [Nocardioides cynanchi]
MEYTKTTVVEAAPERVWEVLSDVEGWPERIAVYQSVERLDEGPLTVGSRAKVKQDNLAAGVWEVTELVPGESFVWISRQPGVHLVGRHSATAEPDGRARLTLTFEHTGPMAWLITLLYGRLIRRYVDLESAALKAAAESVNA